MRLTGVVLISALLVSACGTATVSSAVFRLSEDVQRAEINACRAQFGLQGPARFDVFQYGSAAQEVLLRPELGVSVDEALAVNRCAKARMEAIVAGGEPTAVSVAAPATPVQRPETEAEFIPFGCVDGLGSLQKGTLICPGF